MSEELIDNATIASASRLFLRINSGKWKVRELNIMALDNILEAYVLNDFVNIDGSYYWDYWHETTPKEWHQYYPEVFSQSNSLKIDFSNFKKFVSSDITFFLLNMFIIHIKRKTEIFQDFLTYTGDDFNNYKITVDELFEIDKILKKKWNWKYHHANLDHIDVIMMAYRTIEYINTAEKNGFNLITHPIRNEFIDEIGYLYGFDIHRDYNREMYDDIIKKNNFENSIANRINQIKGQEEINWSKIKFPFISAMIYEKSKTRAEIFQHAYELRNKFKPFRKKLAKMKMLLNNKEYVKLDAEIKKIDIYINELSITTKNFEIEHSISYGFPWSFGFGNSLKINVPKHLRMFTSLSQRYTLPLSYIDSCHRLFGVIRWNKGVRDKYDIGI